MDQLPQALPNLTDGLIEELLARAIDRLAALALDVSILIPEPIHATAAVLAVSESGWCEIGRLRDARNRFWYRVLWHPASGTGRLLRERPRLRRDSLGGDLPQIKPPGEPLR